MNSLFFLSMLILSLFETEKVKIQSEYNRLQMGIIKIAETRTKVGEISIELEKKN